ncbi:Ger(x)C family spore germination protein [Allobacillus sp. GCM10007491]|uniref:Ger(X)C family spore germination protein n=1 Tax=Allobacillus saliphilus TaxID=2912308 RepID=A0A941CTW3_9BACI|nr:Ger(x)C family spore germination protein [Allobacillus saliphilus]MBR7553041.1 Ger(x)C family spore germination protein [Allobacillus saliphilus]
MKMKIKKFFLILSIVVLLTGCAEERVLEDLGIITTAGFDKGEDGPEVFGTFITYKFSQQLSNVNSPIHSSGRTAQDAFHLAFAKTAKKLVTGQLRAVVYGPDLAKEGIWPHLDTLQRNQFVSDLVYITVSEMPSREVLNAQVFEEAPNVGIYIYRLLDQVIGKEEIVDSSLHEFIKNYLKVGVDPITPVLSIEEDRVIVTGLGLFQDDRFIDTIDLHEAFYVRLILDEFKAGELQIELPTENYRQFMEDFEPSPEEETFEITMQQIKSASQISPKDSGKYHFSIKIRFEGDIRELTKELDLESKEVIHMLEKDMAKKIEENISKLLEKTQELNVDSLGFGTFWNAKFKGDKKLTEEEWRKEYPNFQFDIDVTTEILRNGITQ